MSLIFYLDSIGTRRHFLIKVPMKDSTFVGMRKQLRRSVKSAKQSLRSARFDTSDIVQEALIQVWKRICRSDQDERDLPRPLLEQIGRGQMSKMRRFHTAQKRSVLRESVPTKISSVFERNAQSADLECEREEQLALLSGALDGLGMTEKFIIFRKFFDGVSFTEIAADLSKPASWVRRRYLKSLQSLKSDLESNSH